jgi:hypothetical protein
MYARFRLDYAFGFPISDLSGSNGSHRLGFAFKMGGGSGASQLAKDYSNIDLLEAFAHDSLTTHVLLTRLNTARNLSPDQKELLMLLLMRKYPLDDEGLKDVRADMRTLIHKHAADMMDWSQMKYALVKGLPDTEKTNALEALEYLVKNDARSALMRLSLLPMDDQKTDRMTGVTLMALAELGAQTYRNQELDACIDYVRRMVETLPTDEVVLKAYRQLLAMRGKIGGVPAENAIKVKEELPEAPQTLVAPKSVVPTTPAPAMSNIESSARSFGIALGYYLQRKSQGATSDELKALLNQMKAVYGPTGLDLSIVNNELTSLGVTKPSTPATPDVKPQPKAPAATPTVAPKAAPKKAAGKSMRPLKNVKSPMIQQTTELDQAWRYYRQANERGITDYERIEILESILVRYGEEGADKVKAELNRIKRRLE